MLFYSFVTILCALSPECIVYINLNFKSSAVIHTTTEHTILSQRYHGEQVLFKINKCETRHTKLLCVKKPCWLKCTKDTTYQIFWFAAPQKNYCYSIIQNPVPYIAHLIHNHIMVGFKHTRRDYLLHCQVFSSQGIWSILCPAEWQTQSWPSYSPFTCHPWASHTHTHTHTHKHRPQAQTHTSAFLTHL